jgi:hypothetical protein
MQADPEFEAFVRDLPGITELELYGGGYSLTVKSPAYRAVRQTLMPWLKATGKPSDLVCVWKEEPSLESYDRCGRLSSPLATVDAEFETFAGTVPGVTKAVAEAGGYHIHIQESDSHSVWYPARLAISRWMREHSREFIVMWDIHGPRVPDPQNAKRTRPRKRVFGLSIPTSYGT